MEALASVVLLGVGIVAGLQGLGAIARSDARVRDSETMLRLANDKYNELVATSSNISAPDSGDFTDRNVTRFQWSSQVDSTGTDNLIAVTVTVTSTDNPNGLGTSVTGLVYQAPTTTATAQIRGGLNQ